MHDRPQTARIGFELIEGTSDRRHLERILAENRWLAQEAISAREDERKHLARELHDELGQLLTAIRLDAELLERVLPESGPERSAIADILEQAHRAHERIRSMTRRLHPLELDYLGLLSTLQQELRQWEERHPGTRCEFHVSGDFVHLDESLVIDLYRIVQESLTNISRYAQATEVRICMTRLKAEDAALEPFPERRQFPRGEGVPGPGCGRHPAASHPARTPPAHLVCLSIRDDGRGFDPATVRMGLGLLGMRERVTAQGGHFELNSAPGNGLAILLWMPIRLSSHNADAPE